MCFKPWSPTLTRTACPPQRDAKGRSGRGGMQDTTAASAAIYLLQEEGPSHCYRQVSGANRCNLRSSRLLLSVLHLCPSQGKDASYVWVSVSSESKQISNNNKWLSTEIANLELENNVSSQEFLMRTITSKHGSKKMVQSWHPLSSYRSEHYMPAWLGDISYLALCGWVSGRHLGAFWVSHLLSRVFRGQLISCLGL